MNLLSNWYVRRSRRRFWKAENDDDKTWAYVTLYSCLHTLTKLTAPMTPFVADAMFGNLAPADAEDSVHLETYPDTDTALTDETLDRAVRLAMRIASLGRNARSKSGVKVRQPLARVLVSPRSGDEELLPLIESQVLDELNVKALEVAAPESFAEFTLKPNLPVLGPKLGANMGAARTAIAGADAAAVAAALRSGGYGGIEIGGFTFDPGDFLIEVEDKPGIATASDGLLLIGIDTTLTPELEAEGTAREFVHRVQNMRKAAGFEIEDRIVTYVLPKDDRYHLLRSSMPDPSLLFVLISQEMYIRQETLSDALLATAPPDGTYTEEHEIDGATLTVGVARAERSTP